MLSAVKKHVRELSVLTWKDVCDLLLRKKSNYVVRNQYSIFGLGFLGGAVFVCVEWGLYFHTGTYVYKDIEGEDIQLPMLITQRSKMERWESRYNTFSFEKLKYVYIGVNIYFLFTNFCII